MLLMHHKAHFILEVPTTSTISFSCRSKLPNGSFFPPTFKEFENFNSLELFIQKYLHIIQVYIQLHGAHGPQGPLCF